ncbi:MAG: transposase, partial [Thalassobius sp.]|nr:transposase [Thalassovita sp.]
MVIDRPERLWVSDITYVPVKGNFSYLSLVTDAYSRKVVGWAMEDSLEAEGPMKALRMALKQRKNNMKMDLMHHSDRGSQYCSNDYTKLLKKNKIEISMVQSGDPRDNGIAERMHRTLKTEFLYGKPKGFLSTAAASDTMEKNIEAYNNIRPH